MLSLFLTSVTFTIEASDCVLTGRIGTARVAGTFVIIGTSSCRVASETVFAYTHETALLV